MNSDRSLLLRGKCRLSGVTLDGDLELSESNARLNIDSGLTLSGTVCLSGLSTRLSFEDSYTLVTGTIAFAGTSGLLPPTLEVAGDDGTTLTLGSDATVRGGHRHAEPKWRQRDAGGSEIVGGWAIFSQSCSSDRAPASSLWSMGETSTTGSSSRCNIAFPASCWRSSQHRRDTHQEWEGESNVKAHLHLDYTIGGILERLCTGRTAGRGTDTDATVQAAVDATQAAEPTKNTMPPTDTAVPATEAPMRPTEPPTAEPQEAQTLNLNENPPLFRPEERKYATDSPTRRFVMDSTTQ